MPLAYLVDENLRGLLTATLVRTAVRYGLVLDVVQVGDPDGPPRGTADPALLVWAEACGRILISHDRRTMADHLAAHLATGRSSPGVFLLRHGRAVELADVLVLAAFVSDPAEWRNRLSWLP